MTLKEILKEINKGNDVIIHCDTQEKATKFLTICKQKGFKWRGGKELLTPYDGMGFWHHFAENTVYHLHNKYRVVSLSDIVYAKKEYSQYMEFDGI